MPGMSRFLATGLVLSVATSTGLGVWAWRKWRYSRKHLVSRGCEEVVSSFAVSPCSPMCDCVAPNYDPLIGAIQWSTMVDEGKLPAFVQHLSLHGYLSAIRAFVSPKYAHPFTNQTFVCPFLSLSECWCATNNRSDGDANMKSIENDHNVIQGSHVGHIKQVVNPEIHNFRLHMEAQILTQLEGVYTATMGSTDYPSLSTNSTSSTCRVLSIGSGGLLFDWLIVAAFLARFQKLVQRGLVQCPNQQFPELVWHLYDVEERHDKRIRFIQLMYQLEIAFPEIWVLLKPKFHFFTSFPDKFASGDGYDIVFGADLPQMLQRSYSAHVIQRIWQNLADAAALVKPIGYFGIFCYAFSLSLPMTSATTGHVEFVEHRFSREYLNHSSTRFVSMISGICQDKWQNLTTQCSTTSEELTTIDASVQDSRCPLVTSMTACPSISYDMLETVEETSTVLSIALHSSSTITANFLARTLMHMICDWLQRCHHSSHSPRSPHCILKLLVVKQRSFDNKYELDNNGDDVESSHHPLSSLVSLWNTFIQPRVNPCGPLLAIEYVSKECLLKANVCHHVYSDNADH